MAKQDATYRIEGGELLFFVHTPRAAHWVAGYLTTNIAETICFEEDRGREIVTQMIADGMRVEKDLSRT